MSGQINFGELTPVLRANPVSAQGRLANYKLKRKETKDGAKFRFSQSLFDEIGLAHNSLTQMDGTGSNAGKVFLAVNPGNDGVWAKSKAGRVKGKEFKNTELAASLDSIGLKTKFLDLVEVGENNGITYYQVVADTDHPENENVESVPAAQPQEAIVSENDDNL